MSRETDFAVVFARLKALLARHASALIVTADSDAGYSLDATGGQGKFRPLFFGGVQIKKNYVSFYLMPVYVYPDLLAGVSEPLRRRMQGKSCFNFTKLDDALLAELDALTVAGLARYRAEGVL